MGFGLMALVVILDSRGPNGVFSLLSWARTEYPRSVIEQLSASFNKTLPRYSGTEKDVDESVTQSHNVFMNWGNKQTNHTVHEPSGREPLSVVSVCGIASPARCQCEGLQSWNTGRWKGFHRLFFRSGPV